MCCRIGLSLLLATPIACFSEPPGIGASSGSSTGTGSSQVQESLSTTTATTEENSTSSESGEGTTSSSGLETEGSSSSSTGIDGTTGAPPEVILLDLFADCQMADWESSDGPSPPSPVNCDNAPNAINVFGGGWRFPMFVSETFGMQQNVLVVRPYPSADGIASASFLAGPDGFTENGVLEFDYEFVNTLQEDITSRMGFQVFLRRGDGANIDFVDDFGAGAQGFPIGRSGTVSMDTGVLGGADELVIFILSNTFTTGQGVALYNARIVASD